MNVWVALSDVKMEKMCRVCMGLCIRTV